MACANPFAYIAGMDGESAHRRQARGLRFLKMHGLGNDFVVIDARGGGPGVTPALARALGDLAGAVAVGVVVRLNACRLARIADAELVRQAHADGLLVCRGFVRVAVQSLGAAPLGEARIAETAVRAVAARVVQRALRERARFVDRGSRGHRQQVRLPSGELAGRVRHEVREFAGDASTFAGALRVVLRNGEVLEAECPHQRGALENPLTADEVAAKYRENAGLALDEAAVAELEDAVRSLEDRVVAAVTAPLTRASAAVAV